MGVAQTRPTPSCTYAAESTQASRDVECELQQFEVANVRPTDKKLGEGSYGTVVQVMIPGATCAAKIIHEALLSTSGENTVVDKFKRECLLMSSLRHPHVVEFLGVWYPPSSRFPALVMEKLVISLHELLEANSNIPLAIKHSILHDVARGLLYLHSHDPPIIHRDLTAKNVLLNSDMVAKVADLGVARMLEILPSQSASPLTQTPGTTVYMPPEALEPGNVRSYGKMLDIFSFGHLSLFTLTQVFPKVKAPKYTDRSTAKHIARSELKRRADSIEQIHSTLGQQHVLVKLVEQCLHDLPENRPPIEKVIEELDKAKTQISDDYGEMTRLELYKKIFR